MLPGSPQKEHYMGRLKIQAKYYSKISDRDMAAHNVIIVDDASVNTLTLDCSKAINKNHYRCIRKAMKNIDLTDTTRADYLCRFDPNVVVN